MPVYEYRCKECGHEFDKHQSFSEPRLTDCPSCEAVGALRKVFGNVGVTFKGSGFYRTDSRSTDSSSLGSNGSKNGAKSEAKTETKSESKPAKAEKNPTPAPANAA